MRNSRNWFQSGAGDSGRSLSGFHSILLGLLSVHSSSPFLGVTLMRYRGRYVTPSMADGLLRLDIQIRVLYRRIYR